MQKRREIEVDVDHGIEYQFRSKCNPIHRRDIMKSTNSVEEIKKSRRFEEAVARLKSLQEMKNDADPELKVLFESRDKVLARFQPLFSRSVIRTLAEQDFKEFLQFKHNGHWIGLQRLGPALCSNMEKLRDALEKLLDESLPISKRLDALVPASKDGPVKRLGRAVITPILMISDMSKYTVWNSVSEEALRLMGILPSFNSKETFGEKYEAINAVQRELISALNTDAWTYDALLWRVVKPPSIETKLDAEDEPQADTDQQFILERHLHDFLADNWEKTLLGKEWDILVEDGDQVGYEYRCDIGRIDILAHSEGRRKWLIVELKRNLSGDAAVGQVLRYMGWVKLHLCKSGELVQGLIVCRKVDDSLWYAMQAVKDVEVMQYKVDFHLEKAPRPVAAPSQE